MIINPKPKPAAKSKVEKGIKVAIILNSFFFKAGFRNDIIWKIISGSTTTIATSMAEVIASERN